MSDAAYIAAADIQATISASRWTQFSAGATFAVAKANSEIESIIAKTYDDIAEVPAVVKKHGAIIGKYWLFNFSEAVDENSSIYKDCKDSRLALQDVAAGLKSGINDGTDSSDNAIRWQATERRFNIGPEIEETES